jgi:RNA polymerase sigma-70 factor (ECF subfamily)
LLVSPPRRDDDEALIAAYRCGDDAALSVLIERHQARIYRLALGALASPEEAEDATQEALMAMLKSLPRFRGDSRFSTWLYRLTLNTCLKRRPRPARPTALPLPAQAYAIAGGRDVRPDIRAAQSWLRARVARFLAALPDTYRLPVVLSDALDLPASEIAVVLNLSLPAVKARILRGRRRLREQIERYCQQAGLGGWRELLDE